MPKQESFSKAFHANPAPMVVSDPVTGEFIDVNAQWVSLIVNFIGKPFTMQALGRSCARSCRPPEGGNDTCCPCARGSR
jgi:hypothetical protein